MKHAFFLILAFLGLLIACESADSQIQKQIELSKSKQKGATGLSPDGMAIFRKNCINCHGSDGKLGINGAKDLSLSELGIESRVQIITNGKNLMTPFKALLSPEEIEAVANYSLSFKASTN